MDWSFERKFRDVDVSLSLLPLAGVAVEMAVVSVSFLAFSSLDTLATVHSFS
jgi:hypothetical protein